jgi:hypothetical protein
MGDWKPYKELNLDDAGDDIGLSRTFFLWIVPQHKQ